jgi:hypothetical protein
MKKQNKFLTLLAVAALSLGFTINSGDTFCEGFYDGWPIGYCGNNIEWCIAPVAPACPPIRPSERNTYTSGYNRGILEGFKASQRN